jgi:hypothetical protein
MKCHLPDANQTSKRPSLTQYRPARNAPKCRIDHFPGVIAIKTYIGEREIAQILD